MFQEQLLEVPGTVCSLHVVTDWIPQRRDEICFILGAGAGARAHVEAQRSTCPLLPGHHLSTRQEGSGLLPCLPCLTNSGAVFLRF